MIRFDKDRVFYWIGNVDEKNLSRAIEKFRSLETSKRKMKTPAHMVISSAGGDTSSGFAFYDYIRNISHTELTCIGFGEIKSAGIIVFLAGNRRLITPNTFFFFHESQLPEYGKSVPPIVEMRADLFLVDLEENQYAAIISQATGGRHSVKEIRQWSKDCRVFTAEEAVETGLAHEIIT